MIPIKIKYWNMYQYEGKFRQDDDMRCLRIPSSLQTARNTLKTCCFNSFYIHLPRHIHTYIYTYIHTYIDIYIHTLTHSPTLTISRSYSHSPSQLHSHSRKQLHNSALQLNLHNSSNSHSSAFFPNHEKYCPLLPHSLFHSCISLHYIISIYFLVSAFKLILLHSFPSYHICYILTTHPHPSYIISFISSPFPLPFTSSHFPNNPYY